MDTVDYIPSPTSVILRVKLFNSAVTTQAGLQGLTSASAGLIISTIKLGEATATTYTQAGSTIEAVTTLGTYSAPTATKCRFKEVDATNHPGIYEIQIADARFATTRELLVSWLGAANLAEGHIRVPCVDQASSGLGTTTRVEPSQGLPPSTATPLIKLDYMYQAWRNKKSQDDANYKLYADDGTTVVYKAPVTKSAGVVTFGEKVTGP